jgi:hypothetical protein
MTGDIASKLLKGKPLADRILADASRGVQELKARGIHPCFFAMLLTASGEIWLTLGGITFTALAVFNS